MSYWATPREDWPSRNEVESEEAWLHWMDTYEQRFADWCAINTHDPESLDAVLEYEKEWNE